MKPIIYADNAATTKLDKDALEAMVPWLIDDYGNASQPYSFARKPKKALAEAREIIANCINAQPEEVYFTSGGTESDNWAIKGTGIGSTERNAVVTSAIEHHAVLNACASLQKEQEIIFIDPNNEGIVLPEQLEAHITNKTYLASVMLSNNEVGTIEPIQELTEIAHKFGTLFHTDAVQSIGHIPVDVKRLGVDYLSASAHKFNGPKGVGFLYARKGAPLNSFLDGGKQEYSKRAGTENVASIVGMAIALQNNYKSLAKNEQHLLQLEGLLFSILNGSGLKYKRNGSEKHVPGNISLSFKDADGEMLLHRLDLMGIVVSTGAACDSNTTQVSHVLKAMNVPEEYAKGTIRISLGKDNTIEDIHVIADAIQRILHG